MIEGFLALVLCQLVGTTAADALHLRVPGPVLGMLLMLGWLALRRPEDDSPTMRAGDALLKVMPLLFIPAGVGVVAWLGAIREQWLPIGVGMVVPWAAGLLATAVVAALALRWFPTDDAAPEGSERLIDEAEDVEGVE